VQQRVDACEHRGAVVIGALVVAETWQTGGREYIEAHGTSLIYVGRPLYMRDGENDAG
jgi:hypothetical protein